MLSSGGVPADPWRQREQAGTAGSAARGEGLLGRGQPRAKLRCGSRWICLDEYWRGHLRVLCGKWDADNWLLTRRGNIMTCLCLSLQFVQTSVTRWWLNNVPLWIHSAEAESNMRRKLNRVIFMLASTAQTSSLIGDYQLFLTQIFRNDLTLPPDI